MKIYEKNECRIKKFLEKQTKYLSQEDSGRGKLLWMEAKKFRKEKKTGECKYVV